MTTKTITYEREGGVLEQFPEFPPRDDMQNWLYIYKTTIAAALDFYFDDRPDISVDCEIPVGPNLSDRGDVRVPDLSVMKGGDRELMKRQRGYEIASQGKAPDLVLEVASRSTGIVDYTQKREDYERYGVGEYWRYDPSGGRYHNAALAGDRLVEGRYEPIEVEWLDDDRCWGYSETLELYVCWEFDELRFFNPVTQDYIRTHRDDNQKARRAEERANEAEAWAKEVAARANEVAARANEVAARANEAATRANEAATRANEAEARANEVAAWANEAARRANEAERRNAELEAELRRLRGE